MKFDEKRYVFFLHGSIEITHLLQKQRGLLKTLFNEMHIACNGQPQSTNLSAKDFTEISELMNAYGDIVSRLDYFLRAEGANNVEGNSSITKND